MKRLANLLIFLLITGVSLSAADAEKAPKESAPKVQKTDAEWRKQLTDEQYKVLRHEDTERAFTGKYWNEKREGTFLCAGCNAPLFDTKTKFESGTGWPSFWQPIHTEAVASRVDRKLWAVRTEVHCANCGGHLGHVFDDGPAPTGKRYCINSASLLHSADQKAAAKQPAPGK